MDFLEPLEGSLTNIVAIAKLISEAIAVLCIAIGLVSSLKLTLSLRRNASRRKFPFNKIRLQFGMWLALALEFQLGADILATTTTPTLESLGQLAGVALVRTFLNYFLNKELEFELTLEGESLRQDIDISHKASTI